MPELLPAGPGRRLMAMIYDWLLVIAIMMVVSVPVVALLGDAVNPGNAWYRITMLLLAGAFFSGFWTVSGQTLGMRSWRLQLTDAHGGPVTLPRALLRFLCAGVSLLPAGLGFWWQWLDRDGLSWHDRWSGTRVRLLPKRRRDQRLSSDAAAQ